MSTKKKQKRSQRAPQGYNTLPTKVTQKEFNRYIKPHLSMGSRGVHTKISHYKIFNYILYVLHTGMQWENLPVRGVTWSNVYRHHNRWSKDGSYERVFGGSREHLTATDQWNFTALHGDGSNTVAKKGARGSATRAINTKGAKKP